jgi:hypothetical protein
MAAFAISATSENSFDAALANAQAQAEAAAEGAVKSKISVIGQEENNGVFRIIVLILTDESTEMTDEEIATLAIRKYNIPEEDFEKVRELVREKINGPAALEALDTSEFSEKVGSITESPTTDIGNSNLADDVNVDFQEKAPVLAVAALDTNDENKDDIIPEESAVKADNVDAALTVNENNIPEMDPDPAPEWGDEADAKAQKEDEKPERERKMNREQAAREKDQAPKLEIESN